MTKVGRWNRTILLLCLVLNYKQTSTTYILVQEGNTLYFKNFVFEPQKCLLPLAINHDGMEYFMTRGVQETLGYENILVARVKKSRHLVIILHPNQGNIPKSPSFLTIGIGIIHIYTNLGLRYPARTLKTWKIYSKLLLLCVHFAYKWHAGRSACEWMVEEGLFYWWIMHVHPCTDVLSKYKEK